MIEAAYVFIALFIAWIWLDYFRLIDIYDKTKLIYLIPSFALGACAPFVLLLLHKTVPTFFPFVENTDWSNNILFYFYQVSVWEELLKFSAFLLILGAFRNQFREPIDYIAFMAVIALGFSATENVMYFLSRGPGIITGRAVLTSVSHMFDSCLIAYAFVLHRFHPKKYSPLIYVGFFALAVISHGIYDYWLWIEGGFMLTLFYFFITVSWFAAIMNNALNNSSYFSYKQSIDPPPLAFRLLAYYLIVVGLQLIVQWQVDGPVKAIAMIFANLLSFGMIFIIICVRLARFKLILGRWFKFRVELPFTLGAFNFLTGASTFRIQVKGSGHEEAVMNKFWDEFITIHPVSSRSSGLAGSTLAYVSDLAFLMFDEVYYEIRLYESDERSGYETYLIKPKMWGTSEMSGKHPIVALIDKKDALDWKNAENTMDQFNFLEWVYVKAHDQPRQNFRSRDEMLQLPGGA
ncbi:MAG: RsiW-degrading membrane proteinase PrsW (M82 family) [Bacteroidia bacterium]|jgi:RsiW-degrading membrane proteinase PrsW (M82 family)